MNTQLNPRAARQLAGDAVSQQADQAPAHGTVEGYRQGCRGHGECDPTAPWTCAKAWQRYQGDWGFRRQVNAGLNPAQILAAEREQATAAAPAPREPDGAAARTKRAAPKPAAAAPRSQTQRAEPRARIRPSKTKPKSTSKALPKPKKVVVSPRTRGQQTHGTPGGYGQGCRTIEHCPERPAGRITCLEAHRTYQSAYRLRRRREAEASLANVRQHGTPYGYTQGCHNAQRCPASPSCTEARRQAETDRRRHAGIQARPTPQHGTRGGYRAGCHRASPCPASPTCTEANRLYQTRPVAPAPSQGESDA